MFRRLTFLCVTALFVATIGVCETINIGLISYDVLIPTDAGIPGTNVFSITNFTGDPLAGGFALPPDFPVVDSLLFLNTSLTLTIGGTPVAINLGDIAPGALGNTEPVQFADTALFSAAVFRATLSQTSFLLADGRTFAAAYHLIEANLLPSGGGLLSPGLDFGLVTVSDVPEPNTFLFVAAALAMSLAVRKTRNH